jgi:hypothetical protein
MGEGNKKFIRNLFWKFPGLDNNLDFRKRYRWIGDIIM